ncbi:C39 family peptidase [Candidatus Roizmanbacteria bacterium]|nr:C39 family peptidase [Candidatus Roizmanbacteria bacterium]
MRKTIIIASIILVSILVVLFLLNRPKLPLNNNQSSLLTPTTVVVEGNIAVTDRVINSALPLTPYENEDFSFDYSPDLNQLVVQEKTPQAREKFNQWADENGISDLAGNPEAIVFQGQSGTDTTNNSLAEAAEPIIEFFNIFLNLGRGIETTQTPSGTENPSSPDTSTTNNNQPPTTGLAYFAQCDSEYADLPLPDGNCNLCQAGCGPTTVAMIASSYLGSNFNPRTIVNMYKSRGYLLSCAGSTYYDAKSILESLGLKTTDYIVFNFETADQVTGDLKKFLNSGWTFFTLANFKSTGGGHYFWITDIDDKGNIWAYDPYYGRLQAPPFNENSRYPFPEYRIAFGVKK